MLTNKKTIKVAHLEHNKHAMNIGSAFLDWVARYVSNKLDSQELEISGLTPEDETKIREYLLEQEFAKSRKQLGKSLSLNGRYEAMVNIYSQYGLTTKHMTAYNVKKFGTKLIDVSFLTGAYEMIGEQTFPKVMRYRLVNGQLEMTTGIWLDTETNQYVGYIEPVMLDKDYIPAVVFDNNAWGEPDIPHAIRPMLKEFNFWGDSIGYEWEKIKVGMLNVKTISSKGRQEITRDQQNGNYVMDAKGAAANIQQSVVPIEHNQQSMGTILTSLNVIEDKILKYSNLRRESVGTGTNKHNLEVLELNQESYEALLDKQDLRNMNYTKFMRILCKDLNIESSTVTVLSPLSELERMKMETQQAQVDLLKAQAKAAASTTQPQIEEE